MKNSNYRFRINKINQNCYKILIALDFGGYGGPAKSDYIPMDQSAFPTISPFKMFTFQSEKEAQNILGDFKLWLKK